MIKYYLLFLTLIVTCICYAEEPSIIVLASKSVAQPYEEIDVIVFVLNNTGKIISIPSLDRKNGYSICSHTISSESFLLSDKEILKMEFPSLSGGVIHEMETHLNIFKIAKYRFKWKCPARFSLMKIKISLWIDGKMQSSETSIKVGVGKTGAKVDE